jgi:O-antigen/teichoic acid export membrane protein
MIAHKYAVKMLASILSSVLAFISLMVMTRYVGTEYGIMMWAFSFVALFNSVADLGFSSAHIRSISSGEDQNRCITTYIVIKIILTAVFAVSLLATIMIQGVIGSGYNEEMIAIVLSFLVYYVIFNLTGIMTQTYIARMEAGKDAVVIITESTIRSVCLIILAFMGVSAVVLSTSYIIGGVSALIVCLMMFKNVRYRPAKPLKIREYVRFTAPLALAAVLVTAMGSLDRVLIGIFCGDADVGFYSAAMGVIYAMIAVGTVFNGILLSHLSGLNAESRTDDIRSTLWSVQKYVSILILPPTMFMIIFGTEVSTILFGAGYSSSGDILSVLAIGAYILTMLGALIQILNTFGKTRIYGRISVVYAAIALFTLFLFIPDEIFGIKALGLGPVGAALSVVVSNAVCLILVGVMVVKTTKIRMYSRLYIHLMASAASIATAYIVKNYVGISGLISGLLVLALTVSVYFLVLVLTKEFGKKDIKFISEVMNVREAYGGFKDEMKK